MKVDFWGISAEQQTAAAINVECDVPRAI